MYLEAIGLRRIERGPNFLQKSRSQLVQPFGLGRRLSFGTFVLDRSTNTLLRGGTPVKLGRRGLRLLETLASRPGEIVAKAELLDAAWPGIAVEESNLSVQIALLRKIIGTAPDGQDWIATIPRVGYRFQGGEDGEVVPDVRPSLAVLPFVGNANDTDAGFFADGLADELTTALSKAPGLTVIARSSSFAYRGTAADVREVSRALGARYVAEGSVRRDGDRVRVSMNLVDGVSGSQLWAERYERAFTDVFALQDDLTRRIVSELITVLSPCEVSLWPGIPTRGTQSVEAYRCFLRGRVLQRSANRTAVLHARYTALFREAIAIDDTYAAPFAGLAMGATYAYYYKWAKEPDVSLAEAYELVDQAIARDPDDAYIHGVAALVAMYGRNVERWKYEVDEALSLDRNFAPALAIRAPLRLCLGEPELAIDDLQRAIRLDPHFTHNYLHDLGFAHLIAGHYENAVAAFRERIMLVPDSDDSRAYLAAALGNLGLVDDARETWAELMGVNPSFDFDDRIARLPFRRPDDLLRVANGLERAGLPSSPRLRAS